MSNLNLVVGKKYRVKGFSEPVILYSFRKSEGSAKVIDEGVIKSIPIDDILGPIIDGLLFLLAKWIMSLFKK